MQPQEMKQVILIFIFITTGPVFCQSYTLETVLDNLISETSGLIFIDNTLITHNDSSNSNELFEIDITNGSISRSVTITNASNIDWEDLAYDSEYIYIGDFGNFDATRTDLKIYRILRTDYFSSTEVLAETINFSYSEQTDFSVQEFTTNFDAEALVHFNNKLYIFTKNWADGNTNVYEIPKTPGTYSLTINDVVMSQGFVTGATSSTDNTKLVLCGYDFSGSFLIELSGFSSGLFSNGSILKTSINPPNGFSFQTEGITAKNSDEYYISAEAENGNSQGLYTYNLSTLGIIDSKSSIVKVFPNPAKDWAKLNTIEFNAELYSLSGQMLKSYSTNTLNISGIPDGCYIIKLISKVDARITQYQLLIIKND